MSAATRDHFRRAAADIGAHGDNDTLPFDIDNRFIKEEQDRLVDLAYDFSCELARDIPGLFEAMFPHLVPGVVAYLNRQSCPSGKCEQVTLQEVRASTLARPMLFELAVAVAE